jgi:hypothetical protein
MTPPVFFEKSPQAIENKGQGLQKERQETSRGGKLLKTWNLPRRHREHRDCEGMDGESGLLPLK